MREILFRGKRTDNGDWVEGGILCTENWTSIFVCKDYQGNFNEAPYSDIEEFDVIPETVGQYTGLTDKNGTKIFEGDIVKYGDTVHNVVFEQRNGTAYFGLVYSTLETAPFDNYQDLRQIEVIGNIHDNPELLEVSE